MKNLAVLLGNSDYDSLSNLPCCHHDIEAMRDLLRAADKYSDIVVIENERADTLKDQLRDALQGNSKLRELFFYFTGHGFVKQSDFFHCARDFDRKRPNETGLSLDDLHQLLRIPDASVVVKVIDACNSGTALVKTEDSPLSRDVKGFNTLIQISSCLESQSSLTGDPLSVFTENFRAAALRKQEGPVYYMDIVASLKDRFEDNQSQTPFFVSQYTGREKFVGDARQLSPLRLRLEDAARAGEPCHSRQAATHTQGSRLLDLIGEAERNTATPEKVTAFVGDLFDRVLKRIEELEFSDFFKLETVEHPDYVESATRTFIIRVLSSEPRPDNFVTANVRREDPRTPMERLTSPLIFGAGGDGRVRDVYELELNCAMSRAQLKIVLAPQYRCLKQIVLIISCAPSLENCYIFEIGSQHKRRDFDQFDSTGEQVVRRWYKQAWSKEPVEVVDKITQKLEETVREHLESIRDRLADHEVT